MTMGVEEPIDFDRVVSDQSYRRDVINYLNRRIADGEVRPGGGLENSVDAATRAFEGDPSSACDEF